MNGEAAASEQRGIADQRFGGFGPGWMQDYRGGLRGCAAEMQSHGAITSPRSVALEVDSCARLRIGAAFLYFRR